MGSHFRMKTAIKIGMVLGIFTITLVEPNDDLENIVKEMNGRMLLLETKNIQLEAELKMTKAELISKDLELERDVSIIRNPPFIHSCAYQYTTSITSETIPYNRLLYSSTNTEGGGLDIARGVFTSPLAGSYTVTWSLQATDHADDSQVIIYLRQNGQNIDESFHQSYYNGGSGYIHDQGGRTLVLHLDMGDTLDLYCYDCSADIYHTTFCVSLSTADIV